MKVNSAPIHLPLWALALTGVLCISASATELAPYGASITLIEENDAFGATDRYYTQGLKAAFFQAESPEPTGIRRAAAWLPDWGFDDSITRTGFDAGQMIFTPRDLDVATLQTNDRPYAGWLFAGLILQRRGTGWWNRPMLDSFEIEFGVVGPWSFAREAQGLGHELIGFDDAQGWSHQLRNEPGLLLKHSRRLRLRLAAAGGLESDLIPHAGWTLGNINTSVRAGVTMRVGARLPDDFGPQTIDSLLTAASGRIAGKPGSYSAFGFVAVEGRAVGYNEFLDGNVFHDSHRVDRETLVGHFSAGGVVVLDRFEFGYSHVLTTREFAGQARLHTYGSIYLRTRF